MPSLEVLYSFSLKDISAYKDALHNLSKASTNPTTTSSALSIASALSILFHCSKLSADALKSLSNALALACRPWMC